MDFATFFSSFGIWGISGILFVETAFLPAFFLPGDTLLFSVGYFIRSGELSMLHSIFFLGLAAFAGNMAGYYLGYLSEKKIHNYMDTHGEKMKRGFQRTHNFYLKYGLLTLLLGRFVPMVRTIAPFLAGVMKLPLWQFTLVSLLSGFVWVTIGLALGSFFGKNMPELDYVVMIIMITAIAISFSPILLPYIRKFFKK